MSFARRRILRPASVTDVGNGGTPKVRAAAWAARLIGLVCLAAGLLPLFRPPGAAADIAAVDGGFRLLARADVAAVSAVYPDAPAVPEGEIAYFSPGTAQAVLDSLGTSEGIASAPYPGDAVANLPPTLNGVFGGNASLPDYPFIVTSSHPTRPQAAQEMGPYRIEAASAERTSSATSRLGVSAGDAVLGLVEPTARVERQEDGRRNALARTRITGIAAGDVLKIGEVEAVAAITSGTEGAPERTSSLRIEGMTVAGVAVTLTEKGLSVGQSTVTAPGTPPIEKVLEQAGITVRYLPASVTETGVTSAALSITTVATPPGRSPLTVTVTLGAVRVASTALPAELPAIGTGDLGPLPATDPGAAGSGSGAADADPGSAAPESSLDFGLPGSTAVTGDVTAPPATVTAPPTDQAPAGAQATDRRPGRAARVLADERADGRGFYLALVGAGAALVLGSRLLGGLAVRLVRLPHLRPGRATGRL